MAAERFARLRASDPVWLADGGLETRLIYEAGLDLPEFAAFLPLFRPGEREILADIYRSYLAIAAASGLPMQMGTPTWRAHRDCLSRLGFDAPGDVARVNGEAVRFLDGLRTEAGLGDRVVIAGVIGPRADGYDPAGAPDRATARAYHREQAEILAGAGVDLLYAPTFAGAAELEGVAEAMAATGLPYVLAPVIDPDGRLMDGTPFADAIARIDATVVPPPVDFMVGCTHPTRFRAARAATAPNGPLASRVAGLKANASTLPPEELAKLTTLDEGAPDNFAREMLGLRRDYGLRLLGGCCGTNHRHIAALAAALVADRAP